MALTAFAAEVSQKVDLNPTWEELLPGFILIVAVTLVAVYLLRRRRRHTPSP